VRVLALTHLVFTVNARNSSDIFLDEQDTLLSFVARSHSVNRRDLVQSVYVDVFEKDAVSDWLGLEEIVMAVFSDCFAVDHGLETNMRSYVQKGHIFLYQFAIGFHVQRL
jgi:hypothetical protein